MIARQYKFYKNTTTLIPKIFRGISSKKASEALINTFTKILKKRILSQLRFSIQLRGRFSNKATISKEYYDQRIPITVTDQYHLIVCRKCDVLSKASLSVRLKCLRCKNLEDIRRYDTFGLKWDMWAREV